MRENSIINVYVLIIQGDYLQENAVIHVVIKRRFLRMVNVLNAKDILEELIQE